MADLDQIQLPNSGTYNFKDTTQTRSNHRHYPSDLVPLVSKVYASTSYYATDNSWDNSTWYFMSAKPDAWYKPWQVKFKIHSFCPSYSNAESITWGTICGRSDSYVYANFNENYDRAHYYTTLYPLKKAGFDAGYGHAIGISVRYGYNYTNSAYYRTFEVDYISCENCTVTILNTPVKWADWSGTGSTYYNGIVSMDAASRGLQESGDSDTLENRITYFSGKAGAKGIWAYSLFMEDNSGTYQNICTASDGTVTPNNRTIGTKIANTSGFRVGSPIYYCNTNYNANTNIAGWGNVYKTMSAFDSRYSLNTTLTANCLTPYTQIYLVGTINANDGLFYLDSTWWTQTPTTSGKVYILVGACYDSTTSNCRITLYEQNKWYRYNGSRLVEFIDDARTADYATSAASATSATKATQDESGNNIKATYANSFSISDHTITLKNKNGSSLGTVTVPDNNTTYTFANGTNGFTVTPSGGSAQTVTVTPSIANNVTGSGTSGYLTKFNGANTVTNGPQLGSDTTKFLRNDGTWAVPSSSGSSGNKIFITEPTPPYSVGDLWLVEDNNISVCVTARATGSFDSDDWGSAIETLSAEELQNTIASAITGAVTVVTGNSESGGNVIWRMNSNNVPYELLITDTPTNITSSSAKIYRWDANGLRFSSTGYNGTYSTLINTSGQIPAQYLTGNLNAGIVAIQNFTAAMVHGGVLTRGRANNQDGTIEVYDANGTLIAEVSNLGFKYYGQGTGSDRPYYLINTNGFVGYTKIDDVWTQTVKVAFDEFRMIKGYVRDELDIGSMIKIIPMTNGNNSGIAFVAST